MSAMADDSQSNHDNPVVDSPVPDVQVLDKPDSKDTITGDIDSATATNKSEIKGSENSSSNYSKSALSGSGSELTGPTTNENKGPVSPQASPPPAEDQAVESAQEEPETNDNVEATVSAKDSKDALTSTSRRSGTSGRGDTSSRAEGPSYGRSTPEDEEAIERLAAEKKLANETNDLRSQLFYKHDKLCLCVNGRRWEEIPEAVFELKELRCLFVANNHLTELPNEISNLRNIEVSV